MNRLLLGSLFNIVFCFSTLGQTFHGKIFDASTNEPLPYANIGVKGKSIGGISNAQVFS